MSRESVTENLSIREGQHIVDKWIRTVGKGYFSELTNMVLLTEEVGELARVMARLYGDQVAKKGDLDKNLGEEMADILWVLMCLANQTGIDLEDEFFKSLDKKNNRDQSRFF